MGKFSDHSSEQIAVLRVFTARCISVWQFLIFLILWVMGNLPYQLMEDDHMHFFHYKIDKGNAIFAVLASTSLLWFLIVPSRWLALLTAFLHFWFIHGYIPGNRDLFVPLYTLILIAFMLPAHYFTTCWKWARLLILLLLILHCSLLPLSARGIPAYSLYLVALLPWSRLLRLFSAKFQPR